MNEKDFIKELEKYNVILSDKQLEQLDIYFNFLIEYNKKINLTRIVDKKEVYLKHFYDSLTILKKEQLDGKSLCDVGTGAGFPGVVLKIAVPSLKLSLVDSLKKRIIFLKELANKLGIDDINFYHDRFENFSRQHPEEYDIVTARAVSNISFIVESTAQMLKIGGNLVLMRGKNDYNHDKMLDKVSFNINYIDEFKLPIENSDRTIISFRKIGKTNKLYPRNLKDMKNNPL